MSAVAKTRIGLPQLLFYCAFCLAFIWLGRFIWLEGSPFFGGIFLAIGIVLLAGTLYHTLELLQHGDTHLKMEGRAWPGGKLKAELRTPHSLSARTLAVTLQCKRVYWSRSASGDGGMISEDIVWSREMDFPLAGRRCRIEFEVPADALLTSTSAGPGGGQNPGGHYWEICVHADVPGIDLLRTFVVVVSKPPPAASVAS